MKASKLVVSLILFVLAFNSYAQDSESLDPIIFGHDLGWIKFNNAPGLNVEVSDQVSDGCWTNIAAVKNAVELQLIRSGYETYTEDEQKALAPTIRLEALGFDIPSLNGCAVSLELSVTVVDLGTLDSEQGALKSLYSYELASYGGLFTARKADSNNSIKAQFEDLTQSMLVEAQKEKQSIRNALMEQREAPAAKYWLQQLE